MAFYYLLSLLTAPGVALHELSHLFFCWLSRVKVFKVVLFRFGNPAGYVTHQEPEHFYQHVLVSFGPLLINSFFSMIFFAAAGGAWFGGRALAYAWIGLAAGLHAIPSSGDAEALWRSAKRGVWRNPFILVGFPLVLSLYFLNWLKRYHIQLLYVLFLATASYLLKID